MNWGLFALFCSLVLAPACVAWKRRAMRKPPRYPIQLEGPRRTSLRVVHGGRR